ncbi:MAG TPA: CrcB family protein [Mycobacteriales bacterium]|nr:CrcB family protein [Mycobacteriales bacterium]
MLAAVSAGGVLGALARYGVGLAVAAPRGGFPLATFFVNTSGCLALGLLLVLVVETWPPARYVRAFAAVGFVASYTTFSALVVQAVLLARDGRGGTAAAYVAATVAAGLLATAAGIAAGRALAGRRSP